MKSWKSRQNLHTNFMAGVNTKAAATKAAAHPTTTINTHLQYDIIEWLTKLTLLYGVPFEYLTPDVRLLPRESIRFFYIDRNWLDRLVDGAMSIGTNSSRDNVFNEAFFESVYAQIDLQQGKLRSVLQNKTPSTAVSVGGTLSGLLFRSIVVSGWPGLEIRATATDEKTQQTSKVDILRMDHLSEDVLLCIFNGVPDCVEVIEPSEGLHFGVVEKSANGCQPVENLKQPTQVAVNLRGLGFGGYPAGTQIEVEGKPGQYLQATGDFRTGENQPEGVLDIEGLQKSIKDNLPAGALGEYKDLTSSAFAVQMVRGAGLQAFQKDGKPCPEPTEK